MKTIWIRHSESEYNAENKITGQHDPELSEHGKMQSEALANILKTKYNHIESIYSSDLRRAWNTASIINERAGYELDIQIEPRLRERDFGEWSGKKKDQIEILIGTEQYNTIRLEYNNKTNDGESLRDVCGRIAGFLKDIEDNKGPIIILCHAHTIRAAAVVLKVTAPKNVHKFEVKNGEVFEWDY